MYKVFIDHKPIIICSPQEMNPAMQFVKFHPELSIKHVKPFLEEASLEEPFQIVTTDPQEAFFHFFDGYLKIPAAGGLVRNEIHELLLIKRHGMWDIPKGKIDMGEDKETACVREIEEECGITGPVIQSYLTETYHTMRYKGRKALKHTYWYILDYQGDEELIPAKEEGISKVKWQSLEFLVSIKGRTYGSINDVIDAYVKSFAHQTL